MDEYTAYIDESGDEGIQKGSKYFILTAVIVKKSEDLKIAKSIDAIKLSLEMDIKSQLHWTKVKGHPNKMMIMETISNQNIKIINVVIDTTKIKFITSRNLYYYFSEYMYERITQYMDSMDGICHLCISQRSQLKKQELKNHILTCDIEKRINPNRLGNITILPNASRRLLQMADSCCSALGQCLKYETLPMIECVKKIRKRYYCVDKKILGYGLKLVPRIDPLPSIITNILK